MCGLMADSCCRDEKRLNGEVLVSPIANPTQTQVRLTNMVPNTPSRQPTNAAVRTQQHVPALWHCKALHPELQPGPDRLQ